MTLAVSTEFKAKADDPQARTEKIFSFLEDTTYRSADIISFGQFNQKQYEGDPLNSASISVELKNDEKQYNFLRTDKTNIGKAGKIQVGFPGVGTTTGTGTTGSGQFGGTEYITRYRGFLQEVSLKSTDRPRCTMVFGSRVKEALTHKIGSTASPVNLYASARNPADLAWEVLTTHAGLDATTSTANIDIDYASFLIYQTTCSDLVFSLKAEFTGQSAAEALRIIGQLTDAIIFGETDGKFYFRKFTPEEAATPYLFSDSSAHLDQAELFFNTDRLHNQSVVWWGYDPAANNWSSGGSVTNNNSASQTDYGIIKKEFDGAIIWHNDATSAGSFGERFVDRYSEPQETVRFTTKRGTQALIHQMGDNITLTWAQMDLSAKLMRIYGITADISRGVYTFLAEDLTSLNSNFFILDSSTNGILDENVLF